LRVIAEFLSKFRPTSIYISTPTWPNHRSVFEAAGLDVKTYRYFDNDTKGLDYKGMMEDL